MTEAEKDVIMMYYELMFVFVKKEVHGMSNNHKNKSEEYNIELNKTVEDILIKVNEVLNDAQKNNNTEIDVSLNLELDTLTPTERSVSESTPAPVRGDDNFWDLGKPKPRVYAQPKFSADSLSVTEIHDTSDIESKSNSSDSEQNSTNTAKAEKILPREAYDFRDKEAARRPADNIHSVGSSGKVVNTINGPRSVPDSANRIVTSSYRRKPPINKNPLNARKPAETVKSYRPDGILIREVIVRTWETDMEFYGRFASDALISHRASSKIPITAEPEPVPYFSYVPQYAHMNHSQLEYYRWVRECIRNGKYPPCDLSYIQLYIFEIINLPGEILPNDGANLLASIWLHYRKQHPRLDGYLCEWFADYCLIGGCNIPSELSSILYEIVPKAQFKEFYLNNLSDSGNDLGKTVLEVSSDYDYRKSRYYADNKDAYEKYIPSAVTAVLNDSCKHNRGIFSLDRTYRMTRDSYCGAIVSSGIKRRIDIEFLSFTRRANTRQAVTAIAKYTENKLRAVLGIKAKLGVDNIDPIDSALLDKFFEPLIPVKQKKTKDELYMPADYMKNYESEDSGFDFATAQAIEAQSWMNTGRLTGDETMLSESSEPVAEYIPDEEPVIDGEISADVEALDCTENAVNSEGVDDKSVDDATKKDDANTDEFLKEALQASLIGNFRAFCRSHEVHEGDIADRINTIFLDEDELGDVVLENTGSGFELIEDYREDVENWLS